MTLRALLLDVDGTLVDSNEAHVLAWLEAFKAFDYRVGHARIAEEIGKGGDLLVPDVLGKDVEEEEGEELRKAHDDLYKKRIEREGARLFPGVDELLAAIRAAGLATGIATSSGKEGIELLERAIGRKFSSMVDKVATGDDAEVSKPAPHVVEAACAMLGVEPLAVALIGDSLFDAGAARRAGAATVAVLQGFVGREQFLEVGARFIARDLKQLRAELPEALAACSQGEIRFDRRVIDAMMGQAIEAARAGMADGEIPIGAALFDGKGALLGTGYNRALQTRNPAMHAEMDAFARVAAAGKELGKGAILVSTLEPCVMCLGAAMMSNIDAVIYGLRAPADGGTERVHAPRSPENILPRIFGGARAAEGRQLFVDWLATGPDPRERPYGERLLDETTPDGEPKEKTEIKIES